MDFLCPLLKADFSWVVEMTIFGHQTFIELQIKAKSQRLESGNKGLETLFMTTKIFPRAFKLAEVSLQRIVYFFNCYLTVP